MQGRPISEEEKQNIDRYINFIDAAYSMTPQGQGMIATAHGLEAANKARSGQLPSPEEMAGGIQSTTNAIVPGSSGKPSQAETPASPPSTPFKPPTRLPDGRVGYPMSPTQPPRLPNETPTSEPSGARDPQQKMPGTSGTSGATGARPRTPPQRPTGTRPKKGPVEAARAAFSKLKSPSVRKGRVEKLIGKGPFNVEPAANSAEENKRIHEFPLNFDFYRKDGEGGMSYGVDTGRVMSAKDVVPDVRKDVLTVGNGSQVTSKDSNSKVSLGEWGPSKNRLSREVSVIELGNGRNGVGAIRISYEDLKPGQTIVVTGGSLSGCTTMYASDTGHFYGYHAGTYGEGKEPWLTSRDGANAIRYASSKMTNETTTDPHNYEGTNNDLVHVGNKYPFSVIVYNGKHEAPARSGEF